MVLSCSAVRAVCQISNGVLIMLLHQVHFIGGLKSSDIKAIYREKDGIVLLYKRLTGSGSYKWPRNQNEVKSLTWKQFEWLMDGLEIEQPKAIKPPVKK